MTDEGPNSGSHFSKLASAFFFKLSELLEWNHKIIMWRSYRGIGVEFVDRTGEPPYPPPNGKVCDARVYDYWNPVGQTGIDSGKIYTPPPSPISCKCDRAAASIDLVLKH